MTSRRSAFVGTPPTARLRPVSTVSPVAGPTTEIAADPFPLSTLKLTSLLVAELRLQPAGAACPEGSIATPLVGTGAGQLSLEEAATILSETLHEHRAHAQYPSQVRIVLEHEAERSAVEAVVARRPL